MTFFKPELGRPRTVKLFREGWMQGECSPVPSEPDSCKRIGSAVPVAAETES